MRKIAILVSVVFLFFASSAVAQSVGKCGVGSAIWEGQKGIAPQVLAVTTNGTLGNQTFGITTGTIGCKQEDVVGSAWKSAMFIDANKTRLVRDMSVGNGEALEALASIIGIEGADKEIFFSVTKKEFARIFPSSEVTTGDVIASLKVVLSEDSALASYSELI